MMAESDDHERWLRERLQRLVAPPEQPGFADELWERVQAAEHASAHRWRLTSIALAVVAIAAVAAATALAATLASSPGKTTIDQTVSCTTALQGQRPVVWLWGNVRTRLTPVASMQVLPIGPTLLGGVWKLPTPELSFATAKDSFVIDHATCTPSRRRVPLAAAGLPASIPITTTFKGDFREICVVANRAHADPVLLHIRLTLSGGVPTHAELAARNAVTGKPFAYVAWTPTRVASFFASTCSDMGG
jgi:hypothetical protein